MKSLCEKTKHAQKRMMQKVKDALQQRNDMRTQMEEAFATKEAVSTVTKLLCGHWISSSASVKLHVFAFGSVVCHHS